MTSRRTVALVTAITFSLLPAVPVSAAASSTPKKTAALDEEKFRAHLLAKLDVLEKQVLAGARVPSVSEEQSRLQVVEPGSVGLLEANELEFANPSGRVLETLLIGILTRTDPDTGRDDFSVWVSLRENSGAAMYVLFGLDLDPSNPGLFLKEGGRAHERIPGVYEIGLPVQQHKRSLELLNYDIASVPELEEALPDSDEMEATAKATALEYQIFASLVAVVIIVARDALGENLLTKYTAVSTCVRYVVNGGVVTTTTGCPPPS